MKLETATLADQLPSLTQMDIYDSSILVENDITYCLGRSGEEKRLILLWEGDSPPDITKDFVGESRQEMLGDTGVTILIGPADHHNAAALRNHVGFLAPQKLGIKKSFGFGDRLGLATPGHIRTSRKTGMLPIFAQQSMREMERSGRSPQDVIDTATWGVLQEGYKEGFGSDADHLKTTGDIDVCAAAGFTLFTIDPGDHVDDSAEAASEAQVRERFAALAWSDLESSADDCLGRYVGKQFDISDTLTLVLDEKVLMLAAAKYGAAIAHTVLMYRHLVELIGEGGFELEMSVDETATPTTVAEHFFVANELRRLGVQWVSLAPRFVGDFEKGVDFIGDIDEFERTIIQHVAIARHLGPYKISLHSGSDKFSVYPIVAKHAGDLVHVKTAGTSYLEALRAIASIDTDLFREIYSFSLSHYEEDKKTYHVSAVISKAPLPDNLEDAELPTVLDHFDARQALHVTYGSVLMEKDKSGKFLFRTRLLKALKENEETHYATLERHLTKHVVPFG